MTWERLLQKKEQFCQIREHIPKEALESFDKSFDVEYAHNSTAIEGNTLTLIQTRAISVSYTHLDVYKRQFVKPQAADYTTLIGMRSTLGDFYFVHPMLYVCIFLMIIFVFGGILATVAFIATYYTDHMFIVLITPFVLSVFLNSLFSMLGLTDWQMVFFLNPGYSGNRILPIMLEGLIIMAGTFWIFVVKGSKDDIC